MKKKINYSELRLQSIEAIRTGWILDFLHSHRLNCKDHKVITESPIWDYSLSLFLINLQGPESDLRKMDKKM